MKEQQLEQFKTLYSTKSKENTKKFIFELQKLQQTDTDPNIVSSVLFMYPIFKKDKNIWRKKPWQKLVISILPTADKSLKTDILEGYFKTSTSNISLITEYYIKNESNIFSNVIKRTNAIKNKNHFKALLIDDNALEIVKNVFTHDEIIKALRISELFLNENIFNKLDFLHESSNANSRNHYVTFKNFKDTLDKYSESIDSKEDLFKDPIKIIFLLGEFHERQSFKTTKGDIQTIQNSSLGFTSLYDFINNRIAKYVACKKENNIDKVYDLMGEYLIKNNNKEPYFSLFNSILRLIDFKHNVLEYYCYDQNIKPTRDANDDLYLTPENNEIEQKWIVNGNKYDYWNGYYYLEGYKTLATEMKEKQVSFIDQEDYNINSDFSASIYRNKQFIYDLNLNDLEIENNIPLYPVMHFLDMLKGNIVKKELEPKMEFFRRYYSYEESIKNYAISLKKQGIPFFGNIRIETYTELIERCQNIFKKDYKIAQTIVDFHICDLSKKDITSIKDKPIIKIGNICYISTWLFDIITPSQTTINSLFKNKDKLKISPGHKVEEKICMEFENNGFTTLTENQINNKGDYDCLAYKDNVLFVVQAKSTYFRTTLKENYITTSRDIKKAASQIDNNLKDIYENFDKLKELLKITQDKIENIKIFPLIITTSFEEDGTNIQSQFYKDITIHKTSLFELEVILQGKEKSIISFEEMATFSVKPNLSENIPRTNPLDVINYIENERVWTKLKSIAFPEKELYLIQKSPANKLFNDSINQFKNGDLKQAVQLVKDAIEIKPKQAKFHALLGDLFMKQSNNKDAIKHYSKAASLDSILINKLYYNLKSIILRIK